MTNLIQNPIESLNTKIPCPLCIIEDRYSGVYSGAGFLAFNLSPFEVGILPVDDDDNSCLYFWEHEAADYVIGKGETPEEAMQNLIMLLLLDEQRTIQNEKGER